MDEYINDENKIITYKWLSRSLGVHVNQAKQMLYTFVQQQRNNKDNDAISVTYLVAGTIRNAAEPDMLTHKICVVPEERLEAAKAKFSPVTSCHIYSAQKSQLKDSNILYTADYDQLQEHLLASNKYSAITCRTSKLRTDKELDRMRSGGGEAYAPSYKPKTSASDGGSAKAKASSIGAMFSKASKSQPSKATEKKTDSSLKEIEKTEIKAKVAEKKPTVGLASAFAKQAAKPKVVKKEQKVEEKVEEGKSSRKEEPLVSGDNKKSKKNADDEDSRKSKRRRIKVVESSSEEESDIDEVPPTPPRKPSLEPEPVTVDSEPEEQIEEKEPEEEKPAHSTSPVSNSKTGQKARKQKQRTVSKTYVGEDGFLVTERVRECYSTDASEDEEKEPPPKKNMVKADAKTKPEEKNAKKKVSPNKNTGSKQMSLMNFFKKK